MIFVFGVISNSFKLYLGFFLIMMIIINGWSYYQQYRYAILDIYLTNPTFVYRLL